MRFCVSIQFKMSDVVCVFLTRSHLSRLSSDKCADHSLSIVHDKIDRITLGYVFKCIIRNDIIIIA